MFNQSANIIICRYSALVFAQFAGSRLELVDNMKHPQFYSEGPRKIKSVFAVEWSQAQTTPDLGQEPIPNYQGEPMNPEFLQPSQDDIPPPYVFPTEPTTDIGSSVYGSAPLYSFNPYTDPLPDVDYSQSTLYPAFAPASVPSYSPEADFTANALYPDLGNFNAESYLPQVTIKLISTVS
jgi:hypothetical protein